MHIGILGFGFVGKAVFMNMRKDGLYNAPIYDPAYKYSCKKEDILNTKVVIVCLPTPMNEEKTGQDYSICKEWLDYLVEKEYKGIVCIKSTSMYSNVEPYLEKLTIVMNPEFLNARSAIEDFRTQQVVLLGSNDAVASKQVEVMYKECFDLPCAYTFLHVSPYAAIHAKYISNLYHAYKCTFWNMVQEKTGMQAELFDLYATVWQKNKTEEMAHVESTPRGFGGACWPKDAIAINAEWQNPVIDAMITYNNSIRKGE